MSLTLMTDQVTAVPDERGTTMRELVARWQKGDLSAGRPLIDLLGSTLQHVLAQRDVIAFKLACCEAALLRSKAKHGEEPTLDYLAGRGEPVPAAMPTSAPDPTTSMESQPCPTLSALG